MCTFFNRDKLATTHKKLLRLRRDHGFLGYGIYYRLLELMVYDDDHYLDNDPEMLRVALGIKAKAEREALEAVLYDYELFAFTEDETEFYSPSLMHKHYEAGAILGDNLDAISDECQTISEANVRETQTQMSENVRDESQKRPYNLSVEGRANLRKGAKKSRDKLRQISETISECQTQMSENVRENSAKTQETAPKKGGEYKGGDFSSLESIGLESIENNISLQEKKRENNFLEIEGCGEKETRADTAEALAPPTLPEVEARCQEMGYPEGTAEAFYRYHEGKGWRRKGKAVKSWQGSLAYWVSRARQGQGESRRGGHSRGKGKSSEANTLTPTSTTLPDTVEMRLAFEAYYRERTALSFCWSEREHKALTELRDKIRQGLKDEGLPLTPEATTQNFRLLLSIISDPWILKNLSLSIINTKYNEIRATFAQQQRQGRDKRASYELDEIERAADAILRASGQRHASPYPADHSERY